jgi:hypothetical protein
MKPDIQDLEAIKNKLYWERLNSGSQLSKIRKANPFIQCDEKNHIIMILIHVL